MTGCKISNCAQVSGSGITYLYISMFDLIFSINFSIFGDTEKLYDIKPHKQLLDCAKNYVNTHSNLYCKMSHRHYVGIKNEDEV